MSKFNIGSINSNQTIIQLKDGESMDLKNTSIKIDGKTIEENKSLSIRLKKNTLIIDVIRD